MLGLRSESWWDAEAGSDKVPAVDSARVLGFLGWAGVTSRGGSPTHQLLSSQQDRQWRYACRLP